MALFVSHRSGTGTARVSMWLGRKIILFYSIQFLFSLALLNLFVCFSYKVSCIWIRPLGHGIKTQTGHGQENDWTWLAQKRQLN